MAEHQSEGGALVATLRAAGLVLSLDSNGDIDLGGRPKAMAVWHALNDAIEDLPKLVAEALREEAAHHKHVMMRDAEPAQNKGDNIPLNAADPLTRWSSIGAGQQAVMEHAAMGGEAPPREVPVAQATVLQPSSPHSYRKFPSPPHYAGMPVIDARGLSWRARRDLARNAGQEFTEPPPYDMRAFGDSNYP
jgi:hypothetical protein